MMTRLYTWFAAAVCAACVWALYVGAWGTQADRVEGVPKSVRDNPGTYRSHYSTYRRHYGGK